MAQSSGEKTEQPTEKRLREAREKGIAARSRDLSAAVLLLAAVGVVWLFGSYIGDVMRASVKEQIEFGAAFKGEFSNEIVYNVFLRGLKAMFFILSPLFIVLIVFAFLSNFLQTGSVFSFASITPKFSNLNPAENFRNTFFKSRSYIELGKTVLKIIIAAAVAGLVLWTSRDTFVRLVSIQAEEISVYAFGLAMEIGLKIGLVFIVLGVADFFLQRFLLRRESRMTRQEIKEEEKETEGDPFIKSRQRARYREILMRNLAADVRESVVVLTGSDDIAVALRYERGKSNAPVIAAKGEALTAERIRQIAKESDIPEKSDNPLARSLYKLEVEDEIPAELYETVAVILQWVYSKDGERGETV